MIIIMIMMIIIIIIIIIIGAPRNVIELLKNSMKDWKTNLFSEKSPLGAVNINRGIFRRDSLSPLLFVITLIPLTLVLRRLKQGYSFGKGKLRLNHLLFMDDLNLYGSSESDIDSLVKTTKLVTEDIGMSFGIDKCGVLALKRGKECRYEGIDLGEGVVINQIEIEGYKYLGI